MKLIHDECRRGFFLCKSFGFLKEGAWKTLYLFRIQIGNRGPNRINTWWVPEFFYYEKSKNFRFIYIGPFYITVKRIH